MEIWNQWYFTLEKFGFPSIVFNFSFRHFLYWIFQGGYLGYQPWCCKNLGKNKGKFWPANNSRKSQDWRSLVRWWQKCIFWVRNQYSCQFWFSSLQCFLRIWWLFWSISGMGSSKRVSIQAIVQFSSDKNQREWTNESANIKVCFKVIVKNLPNYFFVHKG